MSKSRTITGGAAETVAPVGLAQMRRAPTHPGVILAEWLQNVGLTAAEAGRRMGISRAQMSHVVTGRKPMPHTMAVKVAALLSTSAEMWATMQLRHDLWHAMHDKATAAAARRIAKDVATVASARP
jgi:antitoxin HigA-1